MNSLKGLKDKLTTIETNFTDTANKIEDTTKPLKERLDEKYNHLVKIQNTRVCIDAGGNTGIALSTETINNSKFANILQKEIKTQDLSKPIFVDMTDKYMIPIINIMRMSALPNPEDKMLTVTLDCDKDICCDEIVKFFGEDGLKVVDKCDFVYSSKSMEYKKLLDDEKKKKEMLNKIWDVKYKIKCYKCGKVNDGTFNRLKHSGSRNDEFCMEGHYATCKPCDPNATYKA